MPFDSPKGQRPNRKSEFRKPQQPYQRQARPSTPRINGSAQQKHAQWLARAAGAERVGDRIEAENCRQYAEHWYRMSREG